METKEYTFVDRSKWPDGEWSAEPDKVQWQDEATGLPCVAKRHNTLGHWCGYVGVDETHPLFQKHYEEPNVDVHWGLTYSASCEESGHEHGICHVPAPGEAAHVWWFGFDCAHCDDYSPMDVRRAEGGYPWTIHADSQYRTLQYVKQQCASLASQLLATGPEAATGKAK